MLEVLERDFLRCRLIVEDVGPEVVVGAAVGHRHTEFARFGVEARVAVVFDVALRAHQVGIGLVKQADGAETVAERHLGHRHLAALGLVVRIGTHASVDDGLDQRIAHDARRGRMRIVTGVAIHRVLEVAHEIDDLRGPRPLGLRIGIAHIFPLEDVVLRLAVQAHRVGSRRRLRHEHLLVAARRVGILEQGAPQLRLGTLAIGQHAPVVELEAAAVAAIDDQLVEQHEDVAARLRVLLSETMRRHQLVE